jgi:hypothetical protein
MRLFEKYRKRPGQPAEGSYFLESEGLANSFFYARFIAGLNRVLTIRKLWITTAPSIRGGINFFS